MIMINDNVMSENSKELQFTFLSFYARLIELIAQGKRDFFVPVFFKWCIIYFDETICYCRAVQATILSGPEQCEGKVSVDDY